MTTEATQDTWRDIPGFVLQVLGKMPSPRFPNSQYASWQVFLGSFLFSDRPSPLTDAPLFEDGFEWGRVPLEKVIWDQKVLSTLALTPFVSRNCVSIIEPCQFVGNGNSGLGVRASKNIAYIMQVVANCDSLLFPLWHSGIRATSTAATTSPPSNALGLETLLPIVAASRAVIFEGGFATAFDPESFTESVRHEDLILFTQNLLLSRHQMHAPSIFICLGHQLAALAITRLIHQVVDDVREAFATADDRGKVPEWLSRLHDQTEKIDSVGRSIVVRSRGMAPIRGYRAQQFTVCRGVESEVGVKRLVPFEPLPGDVHPLPPRLLKAHRLTVHRYDQHNLLGTITRKYGVRVDIVMFHSDRVNFEAVLFNNWALQRIQSLLIVHREQVVRSPLSWLLNLPCGVEVCASTAMEQADKAQLRIHTSVAACAVFYEDFETTAVKSSFTLQFHPELCDGVNVVGDRDKSGKIYRPTFQELKQSDGVQLLCRMLHVNSQIP